MSRLAATTVGFLLLLTVSPARAETWTIDASHSNAQFSVRHMMVSNVRGEFTKVAGTVELDGKDLTRSRVEAAIDPATISTRDPKRDAHLKGPDFFDVARYPAITFKSTSIAQSTDGKYKVTGDLTMHGVTKQVVLDVEPLSSPVKDRAGNLHSGTSAITRINRKDFGMSYNAVLETGGVVLGDEITINIDVELVKKAAPASGVAK